LLKILPIIEDIAKKHRSFDVLIFDEIFNILSSQAAQSRKNPGWRLQVSNKSEYPPQSGWFAGFCSLEGSDFIIYAIY
jgi:hypothetical protein